MIALLASPLFRAGIAAIAVLSLLGAIYGVGHHNGTQTERKHWEAAIAQQKAQAAKLIADLVAENARQEAAGAALNAKLAQEVTDARQETNAAHDDYNRAVAERLRLSRSRPSCPAPVASETPSPGSGQNLESPGILISEQALKDLGNLAAGADELVSAMTACRAWAVSVGR